MRPATRIAASVAVLAVVATAVLVVARAGCAGDRLPVPKPGELVEVARTDDYLWTGVAVTPLGHLFVCHPRWLGPHADSLVELFTDSRGTGRRPFPDRDSNSWHPGAQFPLPKDAWVCVQALRADGETIWALDAGNPTFQQPVENAAKLTQIDVKTGQFRHSVHFRSLAPASYANDVRIDRDHKVAYVSDSGTGALLVVDLEHGRTRRLLADHPSTKAEPDVMPVVDGIELRHGPGPVREPPAPPMRVHINGLALDPSGEWLYWQALIGKTLWRAPTSVLRDGSLPPERVAAAVERVGETVVADGIEMDADGNLYLAAIEKNAIVMRRPDGSLSTLVSDPRLSWPDSLALGPDRTLYVTTSQIHRTPLTYPNTKMPRTPYRLFVTALPPR